MPGPIAILLRARGQGAPPQCVHGRTLGDFEPLIEEPGLNFEKMWDQYNIIAQTKLEPGKHRHVRMKWRKFVQQIYFSNNALDKKPPGLASHA